MNAKLKKDPLPGYQEVRNVLCAFSRFPDSVKPQTKDASAQREKINGSVVKGTPVNPSCKCAWGSRAFLKKGRDSFRKKNGTVGGT